VRRFFNTFVTIMISAGAGKLGAQTATVDSAANRFDVAAGVIATAPKDVNQRPQCEALGLPCESPRTFPDFGLVVQAAFAVQPHIALVGEASMYANRWDTVAVNPVDERRENHAQALLVGPRVMTGFFHMASLLRQTSLVHAKELGNVGYRVFAQLLAGPEMSQIAPTRFAIQPGVGVDVKLSYPTAWLRVSGDYRSTRGGPRNLSSGRAMAGLVVAR
jgi:hypothetical protein